MLDKKCSEFIEDLASKSPVPGGGGACAYVGALGTALGSMVGNLTVGNTKYIQYEDDVKEILLQASHIMNKLEELVQKDAECFYPLIQAYKLPRDTEEEKMLRNETIQKCLKEASIVPLEIARCCGEAIILHEQLARKGNVMAISDVGVGVAFCRAALKGAKLNVLINTKQMKDKLLKDEIEKEIEELDSKYEERANYIFTFVENMICGR